MKTKKTKISPKNIKFSTTSGLLLGSTVLLATVEIGRKKFTLVYRPARGARRATGGDEDYTVSAEAERWTVQTPGLSREDERAVEALVLEASRPVLSKK